MLSRSDLLLEAAAKVQRCVEGATADERRAPRSPEFEWIADPEAS